MRKGEVFFSISPPSSLMLWPHGFALQITLLGWRTDGFSLQKFWIVSRLEQHMFSCVCLCYLWDIRDIKWSLKCYRHLNPWIPPSVRALECIGQLAWLASLGVCQVLVQRTFCELCWLLESLMWHVQGPWVCFFFSGVLETQNENMYPCLPASFISMESWVFDTYK